VINKSFFKMLLAFSLLIIIGLAVLAGLGFLYERDILEGGSEEIEEFV